MIRSSAAILALVATIACSGACSDSGGSSKSPPPDGDDDTDSDTKDAAATTATPAPDAAVITEPEYPANAAGLQSLIVDLLEAREAGAADRTYTLTESLRLRDYEDWFGEVFGDKLGARLAADYKVQFDDIKLLADVLARLREQGRTDITIERFESTDDLKAVGYQVAALAAMKKDVALYSVRMQTEDGKKPFHIWSFVHDGKSFRYVGKMKPVTEPEKSDFGDLGEFRVADAKRLRGPEPDDDDDDEDD